MNHRAALVLSACLLLSLGAFLPAAEEAAAYEYLGWTVERVETANAGLSADLVVDGADRVHLVYPSASPDCVKYAVKAGSTWTKQSLQTQTGSIWHTSIDLDSKGNPHIAFTVYLNEQYKLKYATWNADDGWQYFSIDANSQVGWRADLAVDTHDNPHVAYRDAITGNLKHAKWTGSAFYVEVADYDDNVGDYVSIDTDSYDRTYIAYTDHTNDTLKLAYYSLSGWQVTKVDPGADGTGSYCSLVVDGDDRAHVSYAYYPDVTLKYAHYTGTRWDVQTVEGGTGSGYYTALSIDSEGNPQIGYKASGPDRIKHARWNGTAWQKDVVDESPGAIVWLTMGTNLTDYPHMAYTALELGKMTHSYPFANMEPVRPAVPVGVTKGVKAETYSYSATLNDPDGDLVRAVFEWNDGTTTETAFIASGAAVSASHSWVVSGAFNVRVRTIDEEGAISPWSEPLHVNINEAPLAPPAPLGPSSGQVNTRYEFCVTALDPDGDDVRIVIDWEAPPIGDESSGVTSESVFVDSGTLVTLAHTYDEAGDYRVRAMRVDVFSAVSAWGPALSVHITRPPNAPDKPTGPELLLVDQVGDFAFKATDPDGDQVRYLINWGVEGENATETNLSNEGITVTVGRYWERGGIYIVRAMAVDAYGIPSGWGFALTVRVNTNPAVPLDLKGVNTILEGRQIMFSLSSNDTDSDLVKFVFDWDDAKGEKGQPNETGQVASGTTASLAHRFVRPGTYQVRARAVDAYGAESNWSEEFQVNVEAETTWMEANWPYLALIAIVVLIVVATIVFYQRGGKSRGSDMAAIIAMEEQAKAEKIGRPPM